MSNNNLEIIEDVQNKQSEAQKRAKSKYYQKKKQEPEFIEASRQRAKEYYEIKKNDPEYKEHYKNYSKEYYKINSEKTKEYYKNYNYNKKIKEVVEKLENLGILKIAEIIINNKKVKLFDNFEKIENETS